MTFFSASGQLFTKPWFLLWFSLCLLSFPLSGAFGYEAFMLLGGLLSFSQMIAIIIASHSAKGAFWLLHGALWVVLVWYFKGSDTTFFLYPWVPIFLLPVGELILRIIFGRFGKFLWTAFNLVGIGFIVLSIFIIQLVNKVGEYDTGGTIIDLDNEVTLFIFLLIAPIPYVWLTGYGIQKGYIQKRR